MYQLSYAVNVIDAILFAVFIPGSYASFVLLGAWLGWQNFDYNMVPSYDDQQVNTKCRATHP